jgi:hypothetical protein
MSEALEIGKLLRASITGCVVGCAVTQLETPQFGGLVRIPLEHGYQVYGLIYDIHIDDDGLVRQLVTARKPVSPEIIEDNRLNRNVPVEISVLFTGYEQDGRIFHLLPPRPPLILDTIYPCSPAEIARFTQAGRFGYFRHILRATDLPVGELLAAHLKQISEREGQNRATQELIVLLRDDYPTLMSVLGAIGEL